MLSVLADVLIWPGGADIDFLGLTLTDHMEEKPVLQRILAPPTLRYIAHGDSITQGFCGGEESYPELLARLAGWLPINMGIQV